MIQDTSLDAFESVLPHLNELQMRCLDAVISLGGSAIPSEVIRKTGLLDYTARPRLTELRKAGVLRDSGLRRKNFRGRNEIVFEIVYGAAR